MAFANVHRITSPRLSSVRCGRWGLSFNGWRHRSIINEVDVYLLPSPKLIYRHCRLSRGWMIMVKLEASWGVWTGHVALFHG